MSTSSKRAANTTEATAPTRPQPQPWLQPEDADGWTVVARGKGRRRRVAVSVMIDFDVDQSAWLRAEAERSGLDYDEIVKQAVDTARGSGTV